MLVVTLWNPHHWFAGLQASAFKDLALNGRGKQSHGKPQVKRNSVGRVALEVLGMAIRERAVSRKDKPKLEEYSSALSGHSAEGRQE